MKKRRQLLSNKSSAMLLVILIAFLVLQTLYVFLFEDEPPEETETEGNMTYVYYLDVGQGDSAVIQAEGFNMLIDAGESAEDIISFVDGLNIDKFDYAVATHPHSDHIGGMADIINTYEIDNFIMPDVTHTSKTFENMVEALENSGANVIQSEVGYEFGPDSARFTVIGPNSEEYDNLNNYSVSLIMDCNDISFLFTGDAEELAEKEMIENFDVSADVYKVNHHGSSSSSSMEFLEAMDPEYAVISCGTDNSYGHPNEETLDSLDAIGAEVFRTDLSGTIAVYTDGAQVYYGTAK